MTRTGAGVAAHCGSVATRFRLFTTAKHMPDASQSEDSPDGPRSDAWVVRFRAGRCITRARRHDYEPRSTALASGAVAGGSTLRDGPKSAIARTPDGGLPEPVDVDAHLPPPIGALSIGTGKIEGSRLVGEVVGLEQHKRDGDAPAYR